MKIKKNEGGAVIVFIVIVIVVLIGFAGLAIDVSHWMVVKNETQNAADAAALAGARQLGHMYETMAPSEQLNFFCDLPSCPEVFDIARDVSLKNQSDKNPLDLRNEDVTVGRWHYDTQYLELAAHMPYAVRVITRRDENINSSVLTWFAKIVGTDKANIVADAVASLSGIAGANTGDVVPIGLSYEWFSLNRHPDGYCGDAITVYPTSESDGCAGWHIYDSDRNANVSLLRDIIDPWARGTMPTGSVDTSDTFSFIGGTLGTIYDNTGSGAGEKYGFQALWDFMRTRDGDGKDEVWTALVPVYDAPCTGGGSNPSGHIRILGFAQVEITAVDAPPIGKQVIARISCDMVKQGPSGGGFYGLYGSIPKLVE